MLDLLSHGVLELCGRKSKERDLAWSQHHIGFIHGDSQGIRREGRNRGRRRWERQEGGRGVEGKMEKSIRRDRKDEQEQ